jgi:hypothetical protein
MAVENGRGARARLADLESHATARRANRTSALVVVVLGLMGLVLVGGDLLTATAAAPGGEFEFSGFEA